MEDIEPSHRWRRTLLLWAAVIATLALLTEPLWNWQRRALPGSVSIDGVLASSSESGLREGCASAVYRLSQSTIDGVAKGGIAYLSAGRPSANENEQNRYGAWRETPGEIDIKTNGNSGNTIFALYGRGGCNDRSADYHSREIDNALAKRGSFYRVTANREGIIIVMPKERLAAYFYVG